MEEVPARNVAIVGGGLGCKAIMDIIFAETLSQLRMKLIGVASRNPKAVGYLYAKEKGIYTTTDYHNLYKLKDLHMIIELTGSDEVANEISRNKPDHVRFMDHVAALVFWDVFYIEEERIAEQKRIEEERNATRKRIEAARIAERKQIEEALELRREHLLEEVPPRNVAIVGGGPGCKAIMDIIFAERLSQLRMKLIGVASRNPKAVGYLYAKEKGIYTTLDYRDLYNLKDLHMIIELTGSDEVANEIARTKPEHVRLMDHVGALLFWDVFYIEEQRVAAHWQIEAERIAAHKRIEAERIADRKRVKEAVQARRAQLLKAVAPRNVAIVGGGPGSKAVIDMIFAETLSQLPMKLIGVASRNLKAVGYLYAKEKGIYTTTDYRDLYNLKDLHMIIELTGSDEVEDEISRTKPAGVKLMDHVGALLFWDVFYIQEQRTAERRQLEEEKIAERKQAEEVLEMRRAQLLEGVPARNVAIVGGGPGCKAIMDIIFAEKLSQLWMKLIGVASRNPKAVGYLYAKEKGIYTTTDYRDLYNLKDLHMIIELTGSDEVEDEISRTKPAGVKLMDHVAARVFWDVFNIEEQRISERERSDEATRLAYAELHQIFETSADGMRVIDRDFNVLRVNEMFLLMTGKKKEEAIRKKCYTIFPGPLCHTPKCPMTLILGGEEAVEHEVEKERGDGTKISCIVAASALREPDGKLIGIVEDFRDITERRRAEEEIGRLNEELEERVARRTAQLEAANKELTSFAYSVSHDLRAPLRGIHGFAVALLEDYGGQLGAEGRDYLQRVLAASEHMGKLIDGLLRLSRLTREKVHREAVDLSALAQTIVPELKQQDPQRQVEFSITPGLVANCDGRMMRVVLENLLGDAWKFTSKRADARIEFGVLNPSDNDNARRADKPVYFVRDNGVGFDMAYADKLFRAFERLHSTTEFPGTGIGLATVQRIIHRHGGSVWAEGAVEKGATFYFTL